LQKLLRKAWLKKNCSADDDDFNLNFYTGCKLNEKTSKCDRKSNAVVTFLLGYRDRFIDWHFSWSNIELAGRSRGTPSAA
jgi:hypothetical protein